MERRLAAILAADVVGYSSLMGEDEVGTLERLKALRKDIVQPSITERKGRIVKLMGDGLLAEFPSVVEAVQCAIDIQEQMVGREHDLPEDSRIRLRIGVNLGDIIVEGSDIYGDGVNVAARLEGLAEAGTVCVSGAAFDAVERKLDLAFEDMGPQEVKNIAKPVHVYRLTASRKNGNPSKHTEDAPNLPDKPSVAVLPFNNLSGDPEQEYFSDGISEDIITELSKVPALFVVARNTTFMYKNQPQNLQDVAQELSVRHLIEGSVRKAGNRVRITAQLIDGKTGGHMWAEKYDRELTDIFEVQDEITFEIIRALKVVLQPKDHRSSINSRTLDLNAYDLFLQGRRQQHMFTKTNLELAIQLFRQATLIDTNFARAYCGIADSSAFLYQFYKKIPGLLDEINDMSAKALSLAPDLAEAHASRGYAYFSTNDYDNADRAFAKAVELDHNLYEAHYYWGRAHMSRGNSEEAAKHFCNALNVSPHDDQSAMLLMQMLANQDKTAELNQIAQRTVENALRKQECEPDNVRACLAAAFGYLRLDDLEGVKRQTILAQALDPEENSIHYNLACLYALIGDQDSALDRLEQCVQMGEYNKAWVENDSDLDTLRGHPRFMTLIEAMVT